MPHYMDLAPGEDNHDVDLVHVTTQMKIEAGYGCVCDTNTTHVIEDVKQKVLFHVILSFPHGERYGIHMSICKYVCMYGAYLCAQYHNYVFEMQCRVEYRLG